jgi:hypothetical protein
MTHSMGQIWHDTPWRGMARYTPRSRYGMTRELQGADIARHTPRSRYGTTHSKEQIWHDTPRIRYGMTGNSMEQIWHDSLLGADMARPGNPMEQIYHDTLQGADMARHTPWNRYGIASKLPGTHFLDNLPAVHVVRYFSPVTRHFQSPTNLTQKHATARITLPTERCTSRVCHSHTARHCVSSECELQTLPVTTAN